MEVLPHVGHWPRIWHDLAFLSLALYGWSIWTKWLFLALDWILNIIITGSPLPRKET